MLEEMWCNDDAEDSSKVEIEQAEDEFVGQTEEAVGVMKNVRIMSLQYPSHADNGRFLIRLNHFETWPT